MLCRHCRRNPANRPRGLCWGCYYAPGVRDRYPSTSIYARRGIAAEAKYSEPAAAPTRALPGTAEKVAVLEQRARLQQDLWHPLDAPRGASAEPTLAHAG